MTISTELANFRIDNACDTTQLPDTVWLRYYNDGRDVLIDRIIEEKEDYFYNEIRANLVSWQREYTIPKRGELDQSWNPMDWLKKIKGISIKFKSTDTDFTKLDCSVLENLDYDLLSYDETTRPFYVTSDNSNFLYPTPTENITNGMIIYGIMYPQLLTLSSEETLPDNIKKAILLYVAERFFTSQKLYNEATIAGNKFQIELSRIAKTLSGRNQWPKTITTPYLNYLA